MSRLELKLSQRNGRTAVLDSFFTAPLKIAKPFYHESHTEVMLMCASPGMLDGDRYDIKISLSSGARAAMTAQSYNKIFQSKSSFHPEHSESNETEISQLIDGGSFQNIEIRLESGSKFRFSPPPAIPFQRSRFSGRTNVFLEDDSAYLSCDIIACGRSAMGERFAFDSYISRTAVYESGRLVFLDNQRLVPSDADISGIGFFEGYSHAALFYLHGADLPSLPSVSGVEAAMSRAERGICIRAFALSADALSSFASLIPFFSS
jgi:urease accessory protein